jgi:hypothetical protein
MTTRKDSNSSLQSLLRGFLRFAKDEGCQDFVPLFTALLEICRESVAEPSKTWSANLFFNLMGSDGLSGYICERTLEHPYYFRNTFGGFGGKETGPSNVKPFRRGKTKGTPGSSMTGCGET